MSVSRPSPIFHANLHPAAFGCNLYHLDHPDITLHHEVTNDHLDQFRTLHQKIDAHDPQAGEMRQQICRRHHDHPGKYGIKQESHHRLTTGTQGKIRRMAEGAEGHDDGRYRNKTGSQFPDLLRGIVNPREKSSYHEHQCRHDHTAEDAEYDHLVVCILGILQFTCTQILSHHNTDTGTQLKIDNIEQIRDGGGNVQSRHHVQTF